MFSVMAPPRIAPSTTTPLPIAPVTPLPTETKPEPPPIGATDVIFVNGQAFNGRGYEVCGVANQRGRLCGRIGQCPFHHKQKSTTPKRPRPVPNDTGSSSTPSAVRQMAIPPQKSRFKRSWTKEEHRRFLQAMRIHGKGKWKEIAAEVKTRTANQCQSHAQKYFLRQKKSDSERKKKSIHDVTEDDVTNDIPVWPPNPLQTLAASAVQSATAIPITTSTTGPVVPTPLQSQPRSTAVPIAAAPIDESATPPVTSEISLPVSKALGTSSGLATSLGLGLPPENENLLAWSGAMSTSSAAASSPMPTTQSPSTGTSLPVVPVSNGVSTVPVVVPMTSLSLPYASMVPSFIGPGLGAAGAAVVAPPPAPKIRVTVHENGKARGGMALMLPKTLNEFFGQAQAKLRFTGAFCRVFTRSGGEITDLDEMCQDDMLWLSTGEDFMTPR